MKLFQSLFHVSLRCTDVKKTLAYYEKFGFEVIFGITEEDGGEPWNYYLKIANGQYLELQPTDAPNPHPHPTDLNYYPNQNIWHYALETDDMDTMITSLLSQGVPLYFDPEGQFPIHKPEEVFLAQDGCRVCWAIDPDGCPIELMEQSGMTLQKKYDPESYQ